MAVSAPTSPTRLAPFVVLAVTLLVFAIGVAYVTLWLRSGLREQIIRREAQSLAQVASLQLELEAETLPDAALLDSPGELLIAVLRASKKLSGVFAVRVFDAERHFSGALPFPWSDASPTDDVWSQLVVGKPVARLHTRDTAAEVIGTAEPAITTSHAEAVFESWVPLRRTKDGPLAGAAQVWTDGRALAEEFNELDRKLVRQAAFAWLAGGAIIAALLTWAFRRLAAANRELRARGEDLLRANRELALAAKTSALGAVTAHLMHELKNPIAGLEEFVASQTEFGSRGENGELAAASELTRRLRTMVNDVVSVLSDEQNGSNFELTAAEIAELAKEKVRFAAAKRGVVLRIDVHGRGTLPGRRGNLALLVVTNLLNNAIEASPTSSTVELVATATNDAMSFAVQDHGAGLPPTVRERLFQPCTSSKPGGSGLGLAISQQLARQAGGRIELQRSDAAGTCFRVILPRDE